MSDHSSEGMSLERAQAQARQTLKRFSHAVVHELDRETNLMIEVNGVPVRQLVCMDSALEELAAGWTFMQRICVAPRDFDRSTVNENRASVMIGGGVDISRRLAVLNGEAPERAVVPDPYPRDEEWYVPEDVLLDVLREAWDTFRKDRMSEGSIHAALATEQGVEVVAFDITAENSVAKILGWCLLEQHFPAYEILVVNGPVTRAIVDAAVRLGVLLIATPYVPTSEAYMTARVAGANIVGYMRNATVGLFGGPGLVQIESD